jgi:hypothetical protein
MKITLDHNCLINVENNTEIGGKIRAINESPENECFIVNIGASEWRKRGIKPNRYDLFQDLLVSIGLDDLKRLTN